MNETKLDSQTIVVQECSQNEDHKIIEVNTDGSNHKNSVVSKETESKEENKITEDENKKDVVININDGANENDRKRKDYSVYSYYNSKRQLPTTWVMYQDGPPTYPNEASPLDYDPRTRNYFVSLVFTIVFVMIVFTAAATAVVLYSDDARELFRTYGFAFALPAMLVMIGLNYTIACSPCARVMPCNVICLVLAVIAMSIITSYVSVRYETRIVFYAVIATAIVVFVCILLAFTSFDFTAYMLYIVMISVAFGVIFMIFMLTMLVTGTYMKTAHLVMLIVSTLISVVILTMELQMILGGRTVELSEDDYAIAAFLLYTSIVDIFLKLVQIIGIFDNF